MTHERFKDQLKRDTAGVRVSSALSQRTLLAVQGKDQPRMKKKISLAAALALVAIMICAAAIAAANRWGMLDFVGRYAAKHDIPKDAQDYVLSDIAVMENEWVTVSVRELYYDGRVSRMTVDVTPRKENTLIVSEDICMEDPFVNLTNNYVQDGDNDMRPIYQVIEDEGYERVYAVSVFMKGAQEDLGMGSGDCMLGEDGTLTLYSQEEYLTDLPEREVVISAVVMPFEQPFDIESCADYEKAAVLEKPMRLAAAVNPTDTPLQAGEIANIYVSEDGADYPEAGVHVDRIMLEVKPQEIYATVDYTVTDREKFDALEGGLWFEFIDPAKAGEPWEQQLTEGLSGGGFAGAVDREAENPTTFRQRGTLGKNELHKTYTLRAYECWEKKRFETHELTMRPATSNDFAE